MRDNVSKRTSVRALAWKRGDVANDDPRQRVAIEGLRVAWTHVGSMVWMRMHERNDFQSQSGCGGANRVAVRSRNLEGKRWLGKMRLAFKWRTCSDGRGYRPTKEQCNEKAETEPHGGV